MTPEQTALQTALSASLSKSDLEALLTSLEPLPRATQKEVVNIGLILSDVSMKSVIPYFQAAPEILKYILPDELARWAGMGIRIAAQSAALGVRYFREGTPRFSKIPNPTARAAFIELGLDIAARDPHRALIYALHAPLLLSDVTTDPDTLRQWTQQGLALEDYTVAVEYFAVPSLLKYLPLRLLPDWVGTACALAAAKLFFAITFIRTSPKILSTLPQEELIQPLLSGIKQLILFDLESAMALFQNAPKIATEVGSDAFAAWVDNGITLCQEGHGGEYFTLTSQAAKTFAAHLKGGLFLSTCTNVLQLLARGMSGRPVTLQPAALDDVPPVTDGQTIYLPRHVAFFQDPADNFQWYKTATAFQAGYLEFGTFWPNPEKTAGLIKLRLEKRGGETTVPAQASLSEFLESFNNRTLIKQIFDIAEQARVAFLLQAEYPGLKMGLDRDVLVKHDIAVSPHFPASEGGQRPQATGFARQPTSSATMQYVAMGPHFPASEADSRLPPLGEVVELLRQIALFGKTQEPIPQELARTVFECCRMMGAVQSANADVLYSMKAAMGVYDLLMPEDLQVDIAKPMEPLEETGDQVRGTGTESGRIRPSVRGSIDPKRVEKRGVQLNAITLVASSPADSTAPATGAPATGDNPQDYISTQAMISQNDSVHTASSANREDLANPPPPPASSDSPACVAVYDEWDCQRGDYRPGYCHVTEDALFGEGGGEAEGSAFLDQVMAEYGGMMKSLRKGFQYLAPQGVVWVKGEDAGEVFDLDRLIENRVEAAAKRTPDERIYRERRKKERSVAAAFLVDMSGSTEQRLSSGKTILQVEKEALLLLGQAIDAIGDRFALYGFSGRSRHAVEFYIVKNFQDRFTRQTGINIGKIRPRRQNRDGAAIRHATGKLAGETAKTRILALLSDGKPLDDQYDGSYAIADTRKALREAKAAGIHPFCITVDHSGPEYLQGMYGEISYLVVDKIETLPEKLPKIYKRLTT